MSLQERGVTLERSANERVTPLMEQYFAIKAAYSEALVFFQVGDFYELFFDDAKTASGVLGIALTKRGTHQGQPVPLCGVPLHVLDHHLHKLVKAGFHVAICDQLEEARPGTVVRRGVTRVLTPGTLTDTKLLDAQRASYLCSIVVEHEVLAFVCAEILTGSVVATLLRTDDVRGLETQLLRFTPDEIVLGGSRAAPIQRWLAQQAFVVSAPVSAYLDGCDAWISQLFVHNQAILTNSPILKACFEQLFGYIKKNQEAALAQFKSVQCYKPDEFLVLDAATQRNLELVHNNHDGSSSHSLFAVLNRAVTAMGARMIKKWLVSPLINETQINNRLDAVQTLVADIAGTQQLVEVLREVGDIERVVGRIALNRAQVHDYVHLLRVLEVVPSLARLAKRNVSCALLERIAQALHHFDELRVLLKTAINDDASKDWLIKPGFDAKLDELRNLLDHAHDKLAEMERAEQERTGINSLKIRYNQVQGYYIEVTKANLAAVPEYYRRHQTLVNVERFTTVELSELERQLSMARSQLEAVQRAVYERVKNDVLVQLPALRQLAYAIAHLDALLGFALTAYDNGYSRPVFVAGRDLVIEQGKHPVVAQALGSQFIANDTMLVLDQRLWIVTGPNMGGKSTYLRQVALVCIMAQCGSFVPATVARLPIIDRVFTRVGAGDNVAEGKSTFLIEMEETATICTQATEKSLVILDEVGRGTSTYDGLAIAQAVVEYIYHTVKARCLFATHYHELTHLAQRMPGIVNYQVSCKQGATGIVFLHKVIPGTSGGSFGLEVAKLAKLPDAVVARARAILQEFSLQQQAMTGALPEVVPPQASQNEHMQQFCDEMQQLDMDTLSPRQAHEVLCQLKERMRAARQNL